MDTKNTALDLIEKRLQKSREDIVGDLADIDAKLEHITRLRAGDKVDMTAKPEHFRLAAEHVDHVLEQVEYSINTTAAAGAITQKASSWSNWNRTRDIERGRRPRD